MGKRVKIYSLLTILGIVLGVAIPMAQQNFGLLLKKGDIAPDFTLKYLHSKDEFTLSSNKGKKPTVLIFGSYT